MARVLFTPYPSVLPGLRAPEDYQQIPTSPAEFGGLVAGAETRGGQELTQGGGELIGAAIQRQQVFNQIAGDQAINQLTQRYSDLTSGDPATGKKGLFSLRGAEALTQGRQTLQDLADARDEIRAGLQNDRQRLEFDVGSRRIAWYMGESIQRHLDQQQDTYGVATNKATQDVNLQGIGANWNNEGMFQTYLDSGTKGAIREAQTVYGQNLTPDQTTATVNAFRTRAVTARAEAWDASGDHAGALNWLKTQQKNIDPGTYDVLERRLKGGADKDAASAALERAWPGATGTPQAFAYNVGNIEAGGRQTFEGAGAPYTTAKGAKFLTFGTPEQGVKAAVQNLRSYGGGHSISLQDAITKWAPPSENNTAAYIAAVSKETGIAPGDALPLNDPAAMAGVVKAMTRVEKGSVPYGDEVFQRGAAAAIQGTPLPTVASAAGPAQDVPAAVAPPDISAVTAKITADPALTDEQKQIAISQATERYRHYEQATADQRQQLKQSLTNGMTALENGKPYAWDEKQIRALLPGPQADQTIQNLNDAQTVGQVGVFVNGASPDQLAAKQAELQAKIQDGNAPDYRNQLAIYGAFGKAVAARGKALANDPAQFVLTNNEHIAQGVDWNNPASVRGYDQSMLSEQARLGVPAAQQTVLTKNQAQEITQKIMSADPATADTGMQLRQLAQEHGQYMPQVWGSLVKAGLSPQWQLLGRIDNPVYRSDYQRALQEIGKRGQDKFEAAITPDRLSDIKANLPDTMRDFVSSAAVPGLTANGDLVSTVLSGMDTLAKYYALQGFSGTQALQRARSAILGSYSFIPNPNDGSVTMRVPSDLGGVAQDYAAQQQAQLQATALQPMPGVQASADNPRGLTYLQAQEAAREAAQSGVWVTAPDDAGLVLNRRMSGGLGYTPVRRTDGGMVEIRFDDVPMPTAQPAPAYTPTVVPGAVVGP